MSQRKVSGRWGWSSRACLTQFSPQVTLSCLPFSLFVSFVLHPKILACALLHLLSVCSMRPLMYGKWGLGAQTKSLSWSSPRPGGGDRGAHPASPVRVVNRERWHKGGLVVTWAGEGITGQGRSTRVRLHAATGHSPVLQGSLGYILSFPSLPHQCSQRWLRTQVLGRELLESTTGLPLPKILVHGVKLGLRNQNLF